MSLQANTSILSCTTYLLLYGILNKLGLQLLCLHLDRLHYRPKLSLRRPNICTSQAQVSFDFLTGLGKIPIHAYLRV